MTQQAKHTPGPVSIKKSRIKDGEWGLWSTADEQVAACQSFAAPNEANAARLAACWNAHDDLVDELRDKVRQLDCLADKLSSQTRPGHVDYINKADATAWADRLARELEAAIAKATEATP